MTISEERSSANIRPSLGNQYFHLKDFKGKEDSHLRMLAQQRMPVHIEYLQPHLSVPESKASPLALLAATCSSIGKPDSEKKDIKTSISTLSSKPRDGEKKSLFEPYQSDKKVRDLCSPPSITQTSSVTNSKSSIMSIYEAAKPHTSRPTDLDGNSNKDVKEKFHQNNLRCLPVSSPFPPIPSRIPPMPTTHHHHISPDHRHSECTQCKQHRPHSESLTLTRHPPPPTMAAPCACPLCMRNENKCHFQHPNGPMSNLYPPPPAHYKQIPPMMNPCRDPNCTNCSKSTGSLQNFLHPALIQQCTHGGLPHKPMFPPPPLPTHSSSHEHLSKTNPKPFVCNWVSEGKHCGSSYATSEDLFQHLRSHTSLQHQQQHECDNLTGLPPIPQNGPNTCKIHGCPCNANNARKSSPRVTTPAAFSYGHLGSNNLRYAPYQRPPPSVSTPFNYPPHAFHY